MIFAVFDVMVNTMNELQFLSSIFAVLLSVTVNLTALKHTKFLLKSVQIFFEIMMFFKF